MENRKYTLKGALGVATLSSLGREGKWGSLVLLGGLRRRSVGAHVLGLVLGSRDLLVARVADAATHCPQCGAGWAAVRGALRIDTVGRPGGLPGLSKRHG